MRGKPPKKPFPASGNDPKTGQFVKGSPGCPEYDIDTDEIIDLASKGLSDENIARFTQDIT